MYARIVFTLFLCSAAALSQTRELGLMLGELPANVRWQWNQSW